MKNKPTKPKLTTEAQQFIEKWSTWFIFEKQNKELKEAMENELLAIIKDCFLWGQISKATKVADKSMQFTFTDWVKTNSEK